MKDSKLVRLVDKVIRKRKTLKVLSEKRNPYFLDDTVVEELLETAGWAPFHRPAARGHRQPTKLSSMVPWRFYLLDGQNCGRLRKRLVDSGDTTKIPAMLASATNLIQVTWLPNPKPNESQQLFDPTLENMEHIAAASAAIQNLLIAATARKIQTYWSSGGSLRKPETMKLLGIPKEEILLGSVFLFGPVKKNCKTSPGKLRDQRGEIRSWSRWVTLIEERC